MSVSNLNSDVQVVMSVFQPVVTPGLGTPAIFVKTSDTATDFQAFMVKYYDAASVKAKYGDDSDATKLSQLIFAQANRPEHIDIIEYNDISKAVAAFSGEDWVFALLATPTDTDTPVFAMAVTEVNDKFAAVQVEDASKLAVFGSNDHVIGFVHPFSKGRLDAAIIGNVANVQPGTITWKFRTATGILPSDFNDTVLGAINAAHGIAYTVRGGSAAMTSEGWTLSGKYIDDLHSQLWIKNSIVAELQSALNNSNKIKYDANGISLLRGRVEIALERAYQLEIIATDDATGRGAYEVNAKKRSEQSASDISQRMYTGLSFKYVQAGAIHDIVVSGSITDSL